MRYAWYVKMSVIIFQIRKIQINCRTIYYEIKIRTLANLNAEIGENEYEKPVLDLSC